MSNIVNLNGDEVLSPREVSQDAVNTLKDLLERAESGELVAVSGVFTHKDDCVEYFGAGKIASYSMMGAIYGLIAKINMLMEDGNECQ
ncbi:MAG: hypothetical protein Unbinned7865contig1001_71 [Prokaryotic dsDNA virus sp.]|nr:MAG: hypothetical protein Unbinned7865contig1001_71 [Prokaryotic dsDNA virus sp.]|tara:strand:- start:16360 stop:16623 length:264 start_codon:yes stop_codon:yes gene_type:complete